MERSVEKGRVGERKNGKECDGEGKGRGKAEEWKGVWRREG